MAMDLLLAPIATEEECFWTAPWVFKLPRNYDLLQQFDWQRNIFTLAHFPEYKDCPPQVQATMVPEGVKVRILDPDGDEEDQKGVETDPYGSKLAYIMAEDLHKIKPEPRNFSLEFQEFLDELRPGQKVVLYWH